jgi:hypothetical protein
MNRSSTARAGGRSKGLILTGMILAVAMTFIDQAPFAFGGEQTVAVRLPADMRSA